MSNTGVRTHSLSRCQMMSKDDCWLWAHPDRGGRGHGKLVVDGTNYQAHRVMYENFVGEIPEGLELDHLCENPPCINPAHLEPVTHQENIKRHYRNLTHCKNGHEYTEDNVVWKKKKANKSLSRYCRTCLKESYRRRFAANTEKFREGWRLAKAKQRLLASPSDSLSRMEGDDE